MTDSWLAMLGSNGAAALVLALGALLAAKLRASPALAHGLWLLVLLKLVTPPLFTVPIATIPADAAAVAAADAAAESAADADARFAPSASRPVEPIADASSEPARLERPEPERSQLEPSVAEFEFEVMPARPRSEFELEPLAAMATPQIETAAPAWFETSVWSETAAWFETIDWQTWLVGAWMLGSIWMLARLALRTAQFRAVIRDARSADSSVQSRVRHIADKLGLRRIPPVLVTDARVSPMVHCLFGRPRLILPSRLLRRLEPRVIDTLLAHELAHVRRGDHVVRHLELLALCMHWWNPLVWWASHRMRAAEEECCDAWVVWAMPDGRRCYAEALVGAVEFLNENPSALPAAASGVGRVDDLKRRITMIMQGKSRRMLSRPSRFAFVAFAALFLPLVPAIAQGQAGKKKANEEARIADLRAAITQNQEEINDISSQIADLETASREKGKRGESLKSSLSELRTLESVLSDRTSYLESLESELAKANSSLDSMRAQAIANFETAPNRVGGDIASQSGGQNRDEFEVRIRMNVSPKRVSKSLEKAIKALIESGNAKDAEILGAMTRSLQGQSGRVRGRGTNAGETRRRLARTRSARGRASRDSRLRSDDPRYRSGRSRNDNVLLEARRRAIAEHDRREEREDRETARWAEQVRRDADRMREEVEARSHEIESHMRNQQNEIERRADEFAHRMEQMQHEHQRHVQRLEMRMDELARMIEQLAHRAHEKDERREAGRDAGREPGQGENRRRNRRRDPRRREPEETKPESGQAR